MVDLRVEAERRRQLHVNHPTHRPLSTDYDLVGLLGEDALTLFCDHDIDLERRPKGDGGVDNFIRLMVDGEWRCYPIDVKCFRKPYNLIVEVGHVRRGTLYALAEANVQAGNARLLGWEWGETLLAAPTRDFGYGVINHYIDRKHLRGLDELRDRQKLHLCRCREYGPCGIKRADGGYDWYCRDHVLLADPNFFAYARRTEARRPDGAGATKTQSPNQLVSVPLGRSSARASDKASESVDARGAGGERAEGA